MTDQTIVESPISIRIHAFSLTDFILAVAEYADQGYAVDISTNDGQPRAFINQYICHMTKEEQLSEYKHKAGVTVAPPPVINVQPKKPGRPKKVGV